MSMFGNIVLLTQGARTHRPKGMARSSPVPAEGNAATSGLEASSIQSQSPSAPNKSNLADENRRKLGLRKVFDVIRSLLAKTCAEANHQQSPKSAAKTSYAAQDRAESRHDKDPTGKIGRKNQI